MSFIFKKSRLLFKLTHTVDYNQTKYPNKRYIYFVLLVIFSVIVSLKVTTYHAEPKWFDTFHEGESLGTAVSYMHGKVLYKDVIFCHGAFQDPLKSVLSFKIFKESIGAAKTLDSCLKVLSFILLIFLLIRLYKWNFRNTLATFLMVTAILFNSYLQFVFPNLIKYDLILLIPRDFTIFSFLIVLTYIGDIINNLEFNKIKVFLIFFLFSFIPFATLGLYTDRAIYLILTCLIIFSLLFITHLRKRNNKTLILIAFSSGIILAFFFLWMILEKGFFYFFEYSFIIMPKYHELLDGYVFPVFDSNFLFACIVISFNLFWLTNLFLKVLLIEKKFLSAIKNFSVKYLNEFAILLLSVLLFKNALGRADLEHVVYSMAMAYLLSFYILIKYYLFKFLTKKVTIVLISVSLIISVFLMFKIKSENLIKGNFPLTVDDSFYIPDNYKSTISFLNENLKEDEDFLTLTSEASWYYFLKKPSPVRFPVIWLAATDFYQNETVCDLKKKNVKFVLYRNNNWTNTMDGFTNEERLPIIIKYIKCNFIFYKKIEDNELWVKKK